MQHVLIIHIPNNRVRGKSRLYGHLVEDNEYIRGAEKSGLLHLHPRNLGGGPIVVELPTGQFEVQLLHGWGGFHPGPYETLNEIQKAVEAYTGKPCRKLGLAENME